MIAEHHVRCGECDETSIIELPAEEDSPPEYACPACGGRAFQTLLEIKDEHGNVT